MKRKIEEILLDWYNKVYKNHHPRKQQVKIEEELANWIEEWLNGTNSRKSNSSTA